MCLQYIHVGLFFRALIHTAFIYFADEHSFSGSSLVFLNRMGFLCLINSVIFYVLGSLYEWNGSIGPGNIKKEQKMAKQFWPLTWFSDSCDVCSGFSLMWSYSHSLWRVLLGVWSMILVNMFNYRPYRCFSLDILNVRAFPMHALFGFLINMCCWRDCHCASSSSTSSCCSSSSSFSRELSTF